MSRRKFLKNAASTLSLLSAPHLLIACASDKSENERGNLINTHF